MDQKNDALLQLEEKKKVSELERSRAMSKTIPEESIAQLNRSKVLTEKPADNSQIKKEPLIQEQKSSAYHVTN